MLWGLLAARDLLLPRLRDGSVHGSHTPFLSAFPQPQVGPRCRYACPWRPVRAQRTRQPTGSPAAPGVGVSEPERWIVVTGWERHQHRDMARTAVPPWLKVYTRLLSDDDYLKLTFRQRGILLGIWLEYARSRRVLGASPARLGLRLGDETVRQRDLDALSQAGYITFSASKPDSNPASNLAVLEVEIEKEQEQGPTPRAANQLDPEKALELSKIIGELHGVNGSTWQTLEPLAARVPLAMLADLRTRSAGKGPGWVIRALQAEIRTA